jgi:hypothetical protein
MGLGLVLNSNHIVGDHFTTGQRLMGFRAPEAQQFPTALSSLLYHLSNHSFTVFDLPIFKLNRPNDEITRVASRIRSAAGGSTMGQGISPFGTFRFSGARLKREASHIVHDNLSDIDEVIWIANLHVLNHGENIDSVPKCRW